MRSLFPQRKRKTATAFTLIEVLITMVIVATIMVGLLAIVTHVERLWKTEAVDSFAEAQDAFTAITQNLAVATLEPYQDFADSSGMFRMSPASTFTPDHLARRSDLAFVCGPAAGANGLLSSSGRTTAGCAVFFVMPQGYTQTYANAGMDHLLNEAGYFLEFGVDTSVPSFLSASRQRYRWRLKEIRQTSESLQIFNLASSAAWIQQLTASEVTTPVLADNIIALVILPERMASDPGAPLATDFRYDSRDASNPLIRHQLPARLKIAMMAIDESSAQILAAQTGSNPPVLVATSLFQKAAQLDTDMALLDGSLTAQKIRHRLFQREILLTTAAWSDTLSQ